MRLQDLVWVECPFARFAVEEDDVVFSIPTFARVNRFPVTSGNFILIMLLPEDRVHH